MLPTRDHFLPRELPAFIAQSVSFRQNFPAQMTRNSDVDKILSESRALDSRSCMVSCSVIIHRHGSSSAENML